MNTMNEQNGISFRLMTSNIRIGAHCHGCNAIRLSARLRFFDRTTDVFA